MFRTLSLGFPLHEPRECPFQGAALFNRKDHFRKEAEIFESSLFAKDFWQRYTFFHPCELSVRKSPKFTDCARDMAIKFLKHRESRPTLDNQGRYLGYVRPLQGGKLLLVVISPDWHALNKLENHTDVQVLEQIIAWFLYHPTRNLLNSKRVAIRSFIRATHEFLTYQSQYVSGRDKIGVRMALQRHREALAMVEETPLSHRKSSLSWHSDRSSVSHLSGSDAEDAKSDDSFGSVPSVPGEGVLSSQVLAVALFRPERNKPGYQWMMRLFQSSQVQKRIERLPVKRWSNACEEATLHFEEVRRQLMQQGMSLFRRGLFGEWSCLVLLSESVAWRDLQSLEAFDFLRHVVEELIRPLDPSKKTQLCALGEGLQVMAEMCGNPKGKDYEAMGLAHVKALLSRKKGEKMFPSHLTNDASNKPLTARGEKVQVEFIADGVFKMNGRIYFQSLTAEKALSVLKNMHQPLATLHS